MLDIEHAFLLDICLGFSLGKTWAPEELPKANLKDIPTTFLLDGGQLAQARQLFAVNDPLIIESVAGLRAKADQYLLIPDPVVTQKQEVPPGAVHKDYVSLAKYWWPDPNQPDGLPYRYRDGENNPECYSENSDIGRLEQFTEGVVILALAAYMTSDKMYAEKAVGMIQAWMVNQATAQTPHFKFAQLAKGSDKLRYQGIIEARRLIYVCDALRILEHIRVVENDTLEQVKSWFKQLLEWLETSEQGRAARAAVNNIGLWTDLQMLVYARFCGATETAQRVVLESVIPRIDAHIDESGRLQEELKRAKPYDYTAFTLLAMAGLSSLTRRDVIKLGEYSTEEGRSFQNAFEWFNATLNLNQLQNSGAAITQLAAARNEISRLKKENKLLTVSDAVDPTIIEEKISEKIEEKIAQLFPGRKTDMPSGTLSRPSSERHGIKSEEPSIAKQLGEVEYDRLRLRSELNEKNIRLLCAALRYRGIEYFIKNQQQAIIAEHKRAETNAGRIADLEQQVADLKIIKDDLAADVQRQETTIKKLESSIKTATEKMNAVKQEKSKYLKERDNLRKRVNAFKSSTSWKITRPLRMMSTAVKILLGRKKYADTSLYQNLFGKKQSSHSEKQLLEEVNTESKSKPDAAKKVKAKPDARKYFSRIVARGKIPNEEKLKQNYADSGLAAEPDTFVLYRIIGNDLHPRHKKGQSRENLQFILENEPPLPNCEKRFVVNRIMDPDEEQAIIQLLDKHNQQYLHIPFEPEKYKKTGFDINCLPSEYLCSNQYESYKDQDKQRVIAAIYRLKNNYVMNNNGARNAALRDGKSRAKWVLPWDGNCFISTGAWEKIRADVTARPYLRYFAVPMARITDNNELLAEDFKPEPLEEPQLLFRKDAEEEFNEDFCYGRRPKVELFWRLGIPGQWDRWQDAPWDRKRRALSPEAGQFGVAGWVARLNSGVEDLEQNTKESFKERGRKRGRAIINTLQAADMQVSGFEPKTLTNLRAETLDFEATQYESNEQLNALVKKLVESADEALGRGPYSVTDKTTLPPSGNPHDYWHPAPYWWPNPRKSDGLPYVKKDGERVPGTRMYEPDSEKYDRTRLQRVFDDSVILALAWKFSGEIKYAQHGARIMERFFVDPATAMTPHLEYAQVIMGRNGNKGGKNGIIEMKDLYYYLDAVRMLNQAGVVTHGSMDIFKSWLGKYLEWLLTSPQGIKERRSPNNHGTYYDLQVASIAAFLGETELLFETLLRARSRIAAQFAPDGSQPEELTRTLTAHYCCFNFQGWINLAAIAERVGDDFWKYKGQDGSGLIKGAEWLLAHAGKKWPYKQIEEFDDDRFLPIWFALPEGKVDKPQIADFPETRYQIKPVFFPHDGIRPFWNVGLNNNVNVKIDEYLSSKHTEKMVYELRKSKKSNLIVFKRKIENVLKNKSVLVVGSSPDLIIPGSMFFERVVCVNGSPCPAANLGLKCSDITIMVGHATALKTETSKITIQKISNLRTNHLVFINTGDTDVHAIQVLKSANFYYDRYDKLDALERAVIIGDIMRKELGLGIREERVSNGVFAVILAIWGGARRVIMSGFSLSGGHSYIKNDTPRYHLHGDNEFFKTICNIYPEIYTTSKYINKEYKISMIQDVD